MLLCCGGLQRAGKGKSGTVAFVEGEEDLDSEEEAAIAEARFALGYRPGVDKDKLYTEVLSPVTPEFGGVR
jgi:hypothetical protein